MDRVNVQFREIKRSFNAAFGESAFPEYPPYEGEYNVTPSRETQILPTADRHTLRDIIVNPGGEYDIIQYIDGDTSALAIRDAGGEGVKLATKTVTANGTYSASDDDVDGYSEVTVDVAGAPPSVIMAGDTPVAVLPINTTVNKPVYTKIGKNSLIIKKTGKYLLKWYTVKAAATAGTVYTQVYINGNPKGTEFSSSGSAPKVSTLNVACQAGDVIEIYGRSSGTSVITWCSDLTACIEWDNGF